jgi:ankyrin repeat protein
LERGADVSIRRGGEHLPRGGWTPSHYTAGFGLTGLIELLLEKGSDSNATDDEGATPLQVASEEKRGGAAAPLRRHHGGGRFPPGDKRSG